MKIGITYYDYEGRIEKMKEHGYDTVDYNMWVDVNHEVYTYSDKELEDKVKALRSEIEDAGLLVFQVHGPWKYPPADADAGVRDESFKKIKTAIRATKLLGAEYMVVHPLMPYGIDNDPDPEFTRDINLEYWKRAAEEGAKQGVIICLENVPYSKISVATPEQVLGIVKAVNSPYFKVCLDTGHCSAIGGSPAEAVRLLGREYLAVLHVHDNNGRQDEHKMPYSGATDWKDFSEALSEIGYEGSLSLETKPMHKLMNLPTEALREHFEKGLADIARHIARR